MPAFFNKIISQKGQGLLEVLAALAVGTILIVALVSLSLRASSTSNSSRTANQASKLAEQGMEIVVNIRNTNAAGTIIGARLCTRTSPSPCSFSDLYTNPIDDASGEVSARLNSPVALGGSCTAVNSWCLVQETGTPENLPVEGITFSREVFLSDSNTPCNNVGSTPLTEYQVKQIRVVVSWADPSGPKSRSTSDCLVNSN